MLRKRAVPLLLLITVAVPSHAQTRPWTDATGKHKVQAEFVDIANNMVRLRKEDQSIISLPLEKLSKKDQEVAVVLGTYASTFQKLRSKDQKERTATARSLLNKDLPAEVAPAVLDYIRLEIAQLGARRVVTAALSAKAIPLSGDELTLVRLKADPSAHFDKTFILIGAVAPSSFYHGGYDNAEATHYSLRFRGVTKDLKFTGESANMYVPRTFSGLLVDRVVQVKEAGRSGLLVRVRAGLDSRRYKGAYSWNNLELVDWQLFDRATNQWTPWALDGFRTGLILLASLNDAKALVSIISADAPHGPGVVDPFVRMLCAGQLSDVTVPYDQIECVAEVVVAEKPYGDESVDASVRGCAIESLTKLDKKGQYRATKFFKVQSLRAARAEKNSVAAWANKAGTRIAASGRRSR